MDEATVRALVDRQAITDQIYRYGRAMDRIDAELGYSLFHEDGQADYEGVYKGSGRGFIDQVCEQHRRALAHSHQVTNIVIALDGDRAASESYVISAVRFMHGDQPKQVETWGRYIDQWSRRDGRWAIDHRLALRDVDRIFDVTPVSRSELSRRDRQDPSYSILEGLK